MVGLTLLSGTCATWQISRKETTNEQDEVGDEAAAASYRLKETSNDEDGQTMGKSGALQRRSNEHLGQEKTRANERARNENKSFALLAKRRR